MNSIIFSGLVSVAVAMLTFMLQGLIRENRKLKMEKDRQEDEHNKAIGDGVVCLLRVKLIEYHTKYIDEGRISTNGYENWNEMYKAYIALGGNGMIKHMNDDIEELKMK